MIEHTSPSPVERVWEAPTSPHAVAAWLMPGGWKPVVGDRLQFRCEPRAESDGTIHVEILAVDKPRRLSYSWKASNMPKPSAVTVLLTPTRDGGTLLPLEHTGLEGDSGKALLPLFRGGWEQKLTVDLDRAIDRLGAQGVRHA